MALTKSTYRQREYTFGNGYGASVISDGYGGESGLYELAVLKDGRLTYETPITDNVLGFLTEEEVQERLDEVAALTPEIIAAHKVQQKRDKVAELRAQIAELEAEIEALS